MISPAPIQVLGRGGPRGRRVGPLEVSRVVARSLVFWDLYRESDVSYNDTVAILSLEITKDQRSQLESS